jgi:hypothetical protein
VDGLDFFFGTCSATLQLSRTHPFSHQISLPLLPPHLLTSSSVISASSSPPSKRPRLGNHQEKNETDALEIREEYRAEEELNENEWELLTYGWDALQTPDIVERTDNRVYVENEGGPESNHFGMIDKKTD